MSTYHQISGMLRDGGGFRKTANQVVLRLSDIKDAAVEDPSHSGENILVEWGLQKLVDFINAEQWDMADDLISGFPRTMCACSHDIFEKLVELRHKFEKTGAREIIVEDIILGRKSDTDTLGDDEELAKHSI